MRAVLLLGRWLLLLLVVVVVVGAILVAVAGPGVIRPSDSAAAAGGGFVTLLLEVPVVEAVLAESEAARVGLIGPAEAALQKCPHYYQYDLVQIQDSLCTFQHMLLQQAIMLLHCNCQALAWECNLATEFVLHRHAC